MSISSRLHQIDEIANDRWLGISTSEYHPSLVAERPDFRGYSPTSYRDWRAIRPHLDIDPDSSFVDFGAGLGRTTILAAREKFYRVVGVELDRDLSKRGNENIRRARLECPAKIVCADAATFEIPDEAGVLYFCNPFAGRVLASVLENVREWLLDPPLLQIVCNLPETSAFEEQIMAVEWLDLDKSIPLAASRKCLFLSPCHVPECG